MRLNTLYNKLAVALFLLICLLGLLYMYTVRYSTEMYQQEAQQKLNISLAEHIVKDAPELGQNKLDKAALKNLFHQLMIFNPSIEVYLIDSEGHIRAYDAPDEKIKRRQIALQPIYQFLSGQGNYPILGDDPRHPERQKVFSVAPINQAGVLNGYLYIILASEVSDGIMDMLQQSKIMKLTLLDISASLILAFLIGLTAFFLLTRPITRLTSLIAAYPEKSLDEQGHASTQGEDEVAVLESSFNYLVNRIEAQILTLENNDKLRRELVANVSHDLRTPLATLHGYLETLLLKDAVLSPEERQHYLRIAESHSQRLAQMVEELFELSRLESCTELYSMERFSLAELVQDVVQKFELTAAEKKIQLLTQFDSEHAVIKGDIGLMQRVLENLLENALRHTPNGGSVRVTIQQQDALLTTHVADTGCGIGDDEIKHIFDRFYRADKSRQGNSTHAGLGLAIVKRILELHGSQISVHSEKEQGTTFSFSLPMNQ